MPIKVLPPEVTSKIAAGEVIERPASVVKELIENSLDAGASEIAVEVQNGGIGFMRIIDNGCGLSATEAELAIRRHATSKINGLEDLEHIHTLGFRGEALPSIAAVAEMEILTRDGESSAATYLRLDNGRIIIREKKSRPQGTTITVRHLFRNLPARLKFLKSPSTEAGHIINVVSQYALSFPEVRFLLTVDGRITLRTQGDGELRTVASEIYGLETGRKLLEFEGTEGFIFLQGLATPPGVERATRSYLSFFVNRRYVRNSLLAKAIEAAYQGLIMKDRYPLVILNISLPPEEIDVNVHPAKLEVKFRNNQLIFNAVTRTLRNALDKAPITSIKMSDNTDIYGSLMQTFSGSSSLPPLRILGQLSASYILAEGEDGLYLIDQHAAHERVLYDKIIAQQGDKNPDIQGLLDPFTIEVSPLQEETLQRASKLMEALGFKLEQFGSRTYLVRSVPAVLSGANLNEALYDLLDQLAEEKDTVRYGQTAARSIACHGAIRAGQTLSHEEMQGLIKQLEQTPQSRTCPHGRPTVIHLSAQRLKKEFGRIL
jgi:DNA mismatch repair protein MutL